MKCNSCWKLINQATQAYATQCSHVLCHDCSVKHFESSRLCPICKTELDNSGLALIDMVPSADKIKTLCGLDPSFVLQVASRAIDFYNFQLELSQLHDKQELENAKRTLQHHTQQHAHSVKDLQNQMRTLKFQLEAVVSERDSHARMLQELQSRAEIPKMNSYPGLSMPVSTHSTPTTQFDVTSLSLQQQMIPSKAQTAPPKPLVIRQNNWNSNASSSSINAPPTHISVPQIEIQPDSTNDRRTTRIFATRRQTPNAINSPAVQSPKIGQIKSLSSAQTSNVIDLENFGNSVSSSPGRPIYSKNTEVPFQQKQSSAPTTPLQTSTHFRNNALIHGNSSGNMMDVVESPPSTSGYGRFGGTSSSLPQRPETPLLRHLAKLGGKHTH